MSLILKIQQSNLLKALLKKDSFNSASPSEYLFISNDGCKASTMGGYHIDKYLDPVIQILRDSSHSTISLSFPFSTLSSEKCWNPTHSFNRSFFMATVADKYMRVFGVRSQKRKKLFSKILIKLAPKTVFCVGFSPYLSEAARELNIKVVEIFHTAGYKEVPVYLNDFSDIQLPTHIIVFDEMSQETFSQFRGGVMESHLSVNPWPQFVKKFKGDHPELFQSNTPNIETHSKKRVLFTISWGFDGDHGQFTELQGIVKNGLIPESVLEAVRNTQGTVDWMFRLHPAQLHSPAYAKTRKKLDRLLQDLPNAEWEICSTQNLSEVISQTTHHISMESVTSYEAARNGIKSLLMSPLLAPGMSQASRFEDLRSLEYVQVGDWNSNQIVEWVLNTERIEPFETLNNAPPFEKVLESFISNNEVD